MGSVLALGLFVLAGAVGGCVRGTGRLWADTATPTGTLSLLEEQWAYDGEPVMFELEVDVPADYVVFGAEGRETLVEIAKAMGRYQWTHTFIAAEEPQVYEVYAVPYLIRLRRDYIYDRADDTWYFYQTGSDKPDVKSAKLVTMNVTCYRRDVHVRFKGRGGAPEEVALALVTETRQRSTIPPCPDPTVEKPDGYVLTGPYAGDTYDVRYTPTFQEVSRAGKTRVEILVKHADGTLERIESVLDTP